MTRIAAFSCVSLAIAGWLVATAARAQSAGDWESGSSPFAPSDLEDTASPVPPAPSPVTGEDTVDGPTHLRWYGWQPLAADSAAFGLAWAGIQTGSRSLTYAGIGAYGFAAPGIHLAHGNEGRAAASFSLRMVTPLLVGSITSSNAKPDISDGGVNHEVVFAIGAAMGMLGAAVLDGLFVSWESVPDEPRAPERMVEPRDDERPSVQPPRGLRREPRSPRIEREPRFSGFVSWVPGGAYAGVVGTL